MSLRIVHVKGRRGVLTKNSVPLTNIDLVVFLDRVLIDRIRARFVATRCAGTGGRQIASA